MWRESLKSNSCNSILYIEFYEIQYQIKNFFYLYGTVRSTLLLLGWQTSFKQISTHTFVRFVRVYVNACFLRTFLMLTLANK